jgi:rhodanese-related sulfurtransferase
VLLGYRDVKQYWGGLREWIEEGRYLVVETPEAAVSLIYAGAVILDVRDAVVFGEGHIPGARNIPLDVFAADPAAALSGVGTEDTVLVYDRGAGDTRSIEASRMLQAAKFRQVRRYGGGIEEWSKAGMPLE